eukprot:175405_1
MSLLTQVDEAIAFVGSYSQGDVSDGTQSELLTMDSFILNHIFTFLIGEAPLEDGIIFPCKQFRHITYNHPLKFPQHYHVRIDPMFKFSSLNRRGDHAFQIGADLAPATHRAVIISNINGIIHNKIFPFHNMRVFNLQPSCSLQTVHPIFNLLHASIRYLSFNGCVFLGQDPTSMHDLDAPFDKEMAFPPQFENCLLFTLILNKYCSWHSSINLHSKFPQLTSFTITVEDIKFIPQVQLFLDSHAETLAMLHVEINLPKTKRINIVDPPPHFLDEEDDDDEDALFTLKLPPNLEIVSIQCLGPTNFNIDFAQCAQHLKYLVTLESSIKFIHKLLETVDAMSTLKYVVINDKNDLYKVNWELFKAKGIRRVYRPSVPKVLKRKSTDDNSIQLYGYWPCINEVRDCIDNKYLRLLLRELNNKQKRLYLWGKFWFESTKKLKMEEFELIKQDSVD